MRLFNFLARASFACTVFILVVPTKILASQYECGTKDMRNPVVVEASSTSEAQYRAAERSGTNERAIYIRCRNLSVDNSPDIFVRDIRFRSRMQLRPYLPADIKESGKPMFSCDSSGDFLPDNSKDHGNCFEFRSPSTRASYKVRLSEDNRSQTSQVWKRENVTWVSWVAFQNANLISASRAAQLYAASHSTSPSKSTQSDDTNQSTPKGSTSLSEPTTPAPPTDTSLENTVKRSMSDLLKGFGR